MNPCIGCGSRRDTTDLPSLCPSCWRERQAHRAEKAKARRAAFIARNGCTCDTGACVRCRIFSDDNRRDLQ